ncbi:NADPH-Fe(3+) oxidoreductase subunit beta [Desulfuromonas versatilis]|uniref:NADPH-Fe(3+) oxidoreductase subunit beta n=1 Tax=Desulfuromonas versatilis TaxID=2802975 RepID=A0ABN6DT77_9BACT|nr:FAD-dependent oxidoreductase [Desulfuromonas versatilis]BCR03365.1 NADPH-Fe(3+) oxidoreductase subunit beta [Desulfuromonas versatilis]
MAQIVFSSWGSKIVDNRQGGGSEAQPANLKLPATYDGERPWAAFLGWDGVVVADPKVDIVAMAAEYAKRVQEDYCCAKCTPGKKGTRVLQDTLARILSGHGEERDLDTIETVAELLQNCKCTLCLSSAKPLVDTVKHFRADYLAYISGERKPRAASRYQVKLTAPCQDKCPAHIDIPAYIEAIKEYRFDESLATIRENMPLPSVCGRVCPHPCETACRRKNVDEPISIMVLKRSAADWEMLRKQEPPMRPKPRKNQTVAVVGAGPAGLAAAYYLALEGFPVTIYEALPEGYGGGMIAVGIPPYRMPRHILQRDIDIISALGVEIIYDTRIGKDITLPQLKEKYDAVLLAPGAHRSKPMGVEGEDKGYKGFLTGGIDFLREAYMGRPTGMGKKVVVVGGGNTAIDCVRVALREGAEESTLLYRRTRKEMPADVWEVDGADEEGVKFEFLVLPTKIVVDEKEQVTGVECVRMELGEPDASGRRRPQPVEGSEFIIECDTVIPAIGQDPDLSFIPEGMGIDITRWNTVVTKYLPLKDAEGKSLKDGMGNYLSRTLITDLDGVFASGDAEIGPLTVVACVGNGHRAARVIQRWLEEGKAYLSDDEIFDDILTNLGVYDKSEQVPWLDSAKREHQSEIHGRERASYKNYCEVELGFTNSQAVKEAERCLRCYRVAMVAM